MHSESLSGKALGSEAEIEATSSFSAIERQKYSDRSRRTARYMCDFSWMVSDNSHRPDEY
jgi:hypothetical protein